MEPNSSKSTSQDNHHQLPQPPPQETNHSGVSDSPLNPPPQDTEFYPATTYVPESPLPLPKTVPTTCSSHANHAPPSQGVYPTAYPYHASHVPHQPPPPPPQGNSPAYHRTQSTRVEIHIEQNELRNQPPPPHFISPGYPVVVHPAVSKVDWSTGLCDCFEDPFNALVTLCLPCVTYGQIAEIVDGGNTSCAAQGTCYCCLLAFLGIPCLLSCPYRTKLRNTYGIEGDGVYDCIVHSCCEACALCQEYRELKNRGHDPFAGWQDNALRHQGAQPRQVSMMPPVNQNMRGSM